MTQIPELRITTTATAAKQIGVSPATVWRMLQDGRLKGYTTGTRGRWFVYQDSIERLMGVQGRGESYVSSAL